MSLFTKQATRKDKAFWIVFAILCLVVVGVLFWYDRTYHPVYFDKFRELFEAGR